MNLHDNSFPMRLQVYLAHSGIASRRAAEGIIAVGRVTVNGIPVVQMGAKVFSGDEVAVDGKKIRIEATKRYILLNKPAGYVCSLADEKGRPVAADLLKTAYSERLYNVGRLDMYSQGLILFTNDGEFARTLAHPSAELEKEYIVDTSLSLPRGLAERFEKGIRVDGVFYKCKSAVELNARRMKIIMIEGKNREIRNVFRSENTAIKRLVRVRIGNITLGTMQSGSFRELSPVEVTGLLKLCRNNAF